MPAVLLPIAEVQTSILILVAIGFGVGVLAGFFGMGGGWIITPFLHILGLPMPLAVGTGLANIAGQGALGSVKHRKMGNVDYRLGAIIGLSMIAGVEGGKRVIMALDSIGVVDSVVRIMYFLLLGGLGIFMLVEYCMEMRRRSPKRGQEAGLIEEPKGQTFSGLASIRVPPMMECRSADRRTSLWTLIGMGVAVGLLAGMMGSGGGFALIPILIYVVGVSTYVAVSTSLFCVMISGGYGAFTYALGGRADLVAAIWILLGSAVGTQFGSSAIRYVNGYGIRLLYSLMLMLAAASVLMKHLGLGSAALVTALAGTLLMCSIILARMARALLKERTAT